MKRQLSYGEIAELNLWFDKYLRENGITLLDDDYYTEAFMDYQSQYEDGNDNPEVNLLYPTRMLQVGTLVRFTDCFEDILWEIEGFVKPGETYAETEVNESEELIYKLKFIAGTDIKAEMYGNASNLEQVFRPYPNAPQIYKECEDGKLTMEEVDEILKTLKEKDGSFKFHNDTANELLAFALFGLSYDEADGLVDRLNAINEKMDEEASWYNGDISEEYVFCF